MALSWEDLDALITETLASGQPPMFGAPSGPPPCVDNDGNPRTPNGPRTPLGTETAYRWWPDEVESP